MTTKSTALAIFIALIIILTASAAFAQEAVKPIDAESQTEAPLPDNSMAVRIGIALPKANFFEAGVNSFQIAASIREIIGARFNGTGIEAVALNARLPQAIAAEAGEKSCFYILQTTLLRKRGGGKLNSIMPAAGINQGAPTLLYEAADLASTTKSKDEFTFEYSLISTDDNSVKARNSFKTKAKADGEDVLSPMLENMLKTVLAAAK
ncbi:MAG TPA: hypothetical protein VGB68_07550 [Pyrinomonadaceae bacterium]|jgi:hypothetical protein